MKVKISIALSRDLLETVDARVRSPRRRSQFIESALRTFLDQAAREERKARDIEILNRWSKRLNREATDVLTYQVIARSPS